MLIGKEQFTDLDVIRAIFALAFILISFIIGLKILSKYHSTKRKDVISVGLTWIFLSSPWWPLPITFILAYVFNSGLDSLLYRYIMSAFIPLALICWVYSFNRLIYLGSKKFLSYIYLIICVVYSLIYHVLFFTNPDLISIYRGGFQFMNTLFIYIFFIFTIITAIITGSLFGIMSAKSEDIKIRWKGRFLFLAIMVFIIGALLDTFSFGNVIIQTIARLVLIFSSIFYYLGFFFPDKIVRRLTK